MLGPEENHIIISPLLQFGTYQLAQLFLDPAASDTFACHGILVLLIYHIMYGVREMLRVHSVKNCVNYEPLPILGFALRFRHRKQSNKLHLFVRKRTNPILHRGAVFTGSSEGKGSNINALAKASGISNTGD